MKRMFIMICGAMMLTGCADGLRSQLRPEQIRVDDVVLGQDQLGKSWCLVDTSGTTRSQVRELALDAWDAHEVPLGYGRRTACDAGPFTYYVPATNECKGSPETNPAMSALANGGRIAIERDPATGKFDVTFKNNDGSALKRVASGPFKAEDGSVYSKWLAGTVVVIGAAHVVIYDAYIYLLDDYSETGRLSKQYHVELFRTNSQDCIDEEPINKGKSSGPYEPKSDACQVSTEREKVREAPIGDGHHGTPNSQGVCTY